MTKEQAVSGVAKSSEGVEMTAKEKVLKVWPDAIFYRGVCGYDSVILNTNKRPWFAISEPNNCGDSESAWQNAAESLPPQPEPDCACSRGAGSQHYTYHSEESCGVETVEPLPVEVKEDVEVSWIVSVTASHPAYLKQFEDDLPGERSYGVNRISVRRLPTVEASDDYILGFNRCKELAEGIVGGSEFHERIGYLDPVTSVEAKEKCGKPAASFIPRWGMSFACVLDKGHEGDCAQGGNCFKHGEYVGDRCPQWPNCIADPKPAPDCCKGSTPAHECYISCGGTNPHVAPSSITVADKDGTWPTNCIQRAFVEGMKWWQWNRHRATAFRSEVDEAEAEAVKRYGEPTVEAKPSPELDAASFYRVELPALPDETEEESSKMREWIKDNPSYPSAYWSVVSMLMRRERQLLSALRDKKAAEQERDEAIRDLLIAKEGADRAVEIGLELAKREAAANQRADEAFNEGVEAAAMYACSRCRSEVPLVVMPNGCTYHQYDSHDHRDCHAVGIRSLKRPTKGSE